MDEDRQIPEPIQWDQGLLLTPRHFLELAGRYERLQQELSILQPFGWGIRQLEFNEAGIAAGKIEITRLKAIMPDGTFVDAFPGDIPVLTVKDDPAAAKTTVWLTVPATKEFAWEGEFPRFRSVSDGKTSEAIDRLRPQFTLHAEEPLPRFVALPVFRLERSRSSTELINSYEPAWVSVPAGSALIEICARIAALLRQKVELLVSQIRNPAQSLTGIAELRGRLRSVGSGLPVLEAHLNGGAAGQQYGHPLPLYQALCGIAGHVAILGNDLAPPDLPPYNHLDLLASFTAVATAIEVAVNQGVSEHWISHRFDPTADGFDLVPNEALKHYKPDPDQWPSVVIGLRIGREQSRHTVLEWAQRCLIASGDIAARRLNRVLGAARHEWANPADLTAPPGVLLFAIAKGDNTLNFAEKLQLIGEPPAPAEAILYVRDTQGETV